MRNLIGPDFVGEDGAVWVDRAAVVVVVAGGAHRWTGWSPGVVCRLDTVEKARAASEAEDGINETGWSITYGQMLHDKFGVRAYYLFCVGEGVCV